MLWAPKCVNLWWSLHREGLNLKNVKNYFKIQEVGKNVRKFLFMLRTKMSDNGPKKSKNVRKICWIKMPSYFKMLSMSCSEYWYCGFFSDILAAIHNDNFRTILDPFSDIPRIKKSRFEIWDFYLTCYQLHCLTYFWTT